MTPKNDPSPKKTPLSPLDEPLLSLTKKRLPFFVNPPRFTFLTPAGETFYVEGDLFGDEIFERQLDAPKEMN